MHTLALFLLCISCWGREQVDAAGELRHVSSGGVIYAAAPQERGAYAVGATNGQSHYGYNTGTGIAKVEVRQANGSVIGSYRYFDPNGKQIVRSYIADSNGFRVLGNDLPISLDTPVSQVQGVPALTGAFEGTSEFDIPPPLMSRSQHNQQPQQIQQIQPQYSQQDTLIQQQQQEYQRQQKQLEQQREELRIQQQKLEALQRQLDAQQQKIQQQYSEPTEAVPQQQYYPEQTKTWPQQQQIYAQPLSSSSLQEYHPYKERPDTLTGGVTSPYFFFNHHLNYDFPAGFAYPGLPVSKPLPKPVRGGCYHGSNEPGCGSNYIIGRAR